ncbi:MAG: prohibitin family protein [Ruminiclostridium sp.]|nr:prohibitin family protein [Ruminiclostridium sp.]
MAEFKFTDSDKTASHKGGSGGNRVGALILVGVIVVILLSVLFNCFTIVQEGFIGVKYQFGRIVEDNLSAGLNFRIPFVEEIEEVDIRDQIYSVMADAYTSDTQSVNELQLKLNYRYSSAMLSNIIRETGINNVESKLLVPNVAKIAKDAIGKVKAEDLVQSRGQVQATIQSELTEVLSPYGIVVTAFAIENLNFDPAFEASIQEKVIAAQDALKMENKTKEKEEEAKQIVIAAQADADSQVAIAEAEAKAISLIEEQLSNSPNYIEYYTIQKWNGILPQVIGGDGINPFVAITGNSGSGTTTASAGTTSTASSFSFPVTDTD